MAYAYAKNIFNKESFKDKCHDVLNCFSASLAIHIFLMFNIINTEPLYLFQMRFIPTNIKNLYEIELDVFKDNRGWFARTYCKNEFKAIGHDKEWTQLNHSCTLKKGSLRGLHYQIPPFHEAKMVRCVVGAIYDVAIDLRKDSPTFLKWYGTKLSSDNKKMLYIPEGFAHGFQTLTNDCELIYHHTSFYTPNSEGGFRYDDPIFNIQWPLSVSEISERDLNHPYVNNTFEGITL
jgi:dTDP-4-dehydrorhamnose 3,5-epimerase